ncbi:GNAT family N-acetyltransferase [Streptomyces coeruleoprunus]|uniref:GNAT family N-acetyltransferase n=1 Tax=Streptomyces coeruleoprunus TaxID=285563 RepID=A0ABV9XG42_9ACTN
MTIMGAQDIQEAVAATTAALRTVAGRDWTAHAHGLEWTCYDTAVHIGSDFTAYAAQLTGRATDGYVPFEIQADPGTTPDGLIHVIEATGGLLAAVVAATPADVRAWHPYGAAGPDGFAAMGVVEVLLHTHDILRALGVTGWEPPAHLCDGVLDRLFPHSPRTDDPWQTLLWATGRTELPGLPRLTTWRWHSDPVRGERLVLCEVAPRSATDLHTTGSGGFAWAGNGPGDGTRFAAGMVAKAFDSGTYRPGWGTYAIVRTSDRRAIGGIGFHAAPDADGRAEIGYDLVESARGDGYATEALRALADWAFTHPHVTVLTATVDLGNAPSHGVLTRAGFTATGTTDAHTTYELRRVTTTSRP